MREHGSLPRARRDNLLEETVGGELLLYDRNSHTAHCLSPIAAGVWRHCDGERDATELAELTGASENLVAAALLELREKDLLVAEPSLTQNPVSGVSRREAIGRIARVGAAAAGASLIVSATAATPAMASSGPVVCIKKPSEACCVCSKVFCFANATKQKECEEVCSGLGLDYTSFAAEMECP